MREETLALLERFSCEDGCDELTSAELLELEADLTEYIDTVSDGSELSEDLLSHVEGVVHARAAVREALAESADEQAALKEKLAALINDESVDTDEAAELADSSEETEEEEATELSSEDNAEEVAEEATEEAEAVVAAAEQKVSKVPFDVKADLSKWQRTPTPKVVIDEAPENEGSLVASGHAPTSGEKISTRRRAAELIHEVFIGTPTEPGMFTAMTGDLPVPANVPVLDQTEVKNSDLVTIKLRESTEKWSLTADGSFCAPITPDLSFCGLSDGVRNIVQASLPRVGAPRGRVQFMSTPKFDDFVTTLAANAGTNFTEADSIAVDPDLFGAAGNWKTCFQVDCPTQQTPATLEAWYTCVYHKHFTTTAYPEYVEFFINESLKVHQYSESIDLLNDVLALPQTRAIPAYDISTHLTGTIGIRGFGALLAEFNRRAYALRRAYWLPEDAVIDVWLPEGVYDQIKQDFFLRECCGDDNFMISDAEIDAFFQNIGLRVNFIANWQRVGPIGTSANTTGADLTTASWDYGLGANTFQFLMFIPGTLALLWEPRFNVGVTRSQDAALIRQNAFQLFTETFYGVVTPCDYQIQLHEVTWCPGGETSGAVTTNDPLFTGTVC